MQKEPFFMISSYHVTLSVIGIIIILACWLPRVFSKREPAAAPLMMVFGGAAALLISGLPTPPDPGQSPLPWEFISELTIIIALFAAGLRKDAHPGVSADFKP